MNDAKIINDPVFGFIKIPSWDSPQSFILVHDTRGFSIHWEPSI